MPTSLVGGPQPLHARQGREMQRYSQDGARLVAGYVATPGCLPVGARFRQCQNIAALKIYCRDSILVCCNRCIPVRVSKVNGKVEVSVLMITSRGGKGMVFPKVRQRLGSWVTSGACALIAQPARCDMSCTAHICSNQALPDPNRDSVCMCCNKASHMCMHHCAHAVVPAQRYVTYMDQMCNSQCCCADAECPLPSIWIAHTLNVESAMLAILANALGAWSQLPSAFTRSFISQSPYIVVGLGSI